MAKKNKNRNRRVNNSGGNMNQAKADLIKQFTADRIEKALHDNRFEEIVKDYEHFKEELKKNNEEEKLKLQSEFDDKKKELIGKEKQIESEYENIEKLKETELKKKKDNQEVLAEEYFNKLIAKSDEKLAIRKKEMEDSIREEELRLEVLHEEYESKIKTNKAEIEMEYKKHKKRMEKEENEVKDKVKKADLQIDEDKKAFEKEKRTFAMEKDEFNYQKEFLQEEKKGLEVIKERYSPQKFVDMKLKYEELKRIREVELKRFNEMKDNYANLKSRLPGSCAELEVVVAENESLKRENGEFANRLAQYPSVQEMERLRNDAIKVESLKDEIMSESKRRQEAEAKVDSINLGTRELEEARKVARTLTTLNDHLQDELEKINKMYQTSKHAKFQALCEIDKELETKNWNSHGNTLISLKKLVAYVRDYGAQNSNLYYSEKMLRCYFASMASANIIILQGLSGTGKSSLPRLLGEALNFKFELFPVQPSWRDNRELLGYDNDFTKRFKETEFTKFMYKISAPHYDSSVNLAVLDEMNLARVEYYFADFLAVLENDVSKWTIPLVSAYDEVESRIPKYLINKTSLKIKGNTWFVGTVNRDESTFGITNKVYDRAMVIDFNKREEAFEGKSVEQISMSFDELNQLFSDARVNPNNLMNERDKAKVKRIDDFLKERMSITFGNRIEKQIEAYVPVFVAAGGTKEEALDYLFAYKVLRQLEGRYEPYLKKSIKELKELINDEFSNKFSESIKLLSRKEEQLGG